MLYYFAQSPFFDPTSNNGIVFTQSQITNPEILGTRQQFEEELSKRSGLEFRVVQSHQNYGPDVGPDQGRWVIQKQRREKQAGRPDQVTPLATYFVIGDLILMAPSIGNILWGKLMDSMQKFQHFASLSSAQPLYTPALGHHYMHQASKPEDPPRAASTLPSRSGSLSPSQEDIHMTGSQDSSDSMKGIYTASNQVATDRRALVDSFQTFVRYGNEYTDDVELIGEPGNFSFKRRVLPKQQAPSNAMIQEIPTAQSRPASLQQPTQAIPDLEAASEQAKRDDSPAQQPKSRRRKSKVLTPSMSPVSTFRSPTEA